MKKNTKILLFEGAYILLLLAMFLLPLFSAPEISITRNTLSELGAQFSPYSWIMNSIFAALALSAVISGWGCFEGFVFLRIILVLFGISLVLSAFFNQAPVNPEIRYNIREAGWHMYFVCTTWIAFIILTFSTALMLEKQTDRLLAIITGISAILLSLLASEADRTAGIWQRLMFIISFGWMIYTYKTMDY